MRPRPVVRTQASSTPVYVSNSAPTTLLVVRATRSPGPDCLGARTEYRGTVSLLGNTRRSCSSIARVDRLHLTVSCRLEMSETAVVEKKWSQDLSHNIGVGLMPLVKVTSLAFGPFKGRPGESDVGEPQQPLPATPLDQLNKIIESAHNLKDEWANTPKKEKAQLLRQCMDNAVAVGPTSVAKTTKVKGRYPDDGEEALSYTCIIQGMREIAESYEANCRLSPPGIYTRDNGQYVARVFPRGFKENLLFSGYRGEIWIQPGRPPTQGSQMHEISEGRVSAALGAGNQVNLVAFDVLDAMYRHNCVCVMKLNPLFDYLTDVYETIFEPLISKGYLAIVHGGAEQGKYLMEHALVSRRSMTGSDKTYDALVWKTDGDKKGPAPPLAQNFDCELGCVTPYIICPGEWSDSDLAYQARNIAGAIVHNASHNCLAAQVILTSSAWPQREAFLEEVRAALRKCAKRRAWYPGSMQKYEQFMAENPGAEVLGESGEGIVPWTLLVGVDPHSDQSFFRSELWCGAAAEVVFDASNVPAFLTAAVEFSNDKLFGNLSCAVFVPPATEKLYAKEVDNAIADLRYGSICVNGNTQLSFGISKLMWGAFPGNTPEDIQSGVGVSHNTLFFDHPQKSVMRVPWRVYPTPLWLHDGVNTEALGLAAMKYFAYQKWADLIVLLFQALRN
mmetsp:Transcript_9731/g.35647  ORF Transcript_9731/g.35647 Transcript_9731/m.35647 type:complete len:674 (+) Transcript_9731:213-2234(+)